MADLGGAIAAEIPDDPDLERAETNHRLLGLESSGPTATALQDLASTVDSRFLSPPLTPRMPAARRILRRRVV
jgi:hypothetical protein